MKKYFFDSHKTFKPFSVEKETNETEREFSRRCWKIYSELVNEHETPATGNRVYMSDKERQIY